MFFFKQFTATHRSLYSAISKIQFSSKVNMSSPNLIQNTIQFVKDEVKGNDGSHDWFHVERVWKLAKRIAQEEANADLEIVELGALLHDVQDFKYSGSETAGAEAASAFLKTQNVPQDKIDKVIYIINNISYKNELKSSNDASPKAIITPELACVQDADRIDALGAIGIARTFAYSGKKSRPLYDPNIPPKINLTKEEYMKRESENKPNQDTAVNHFYEKILKLKYMMKTETGKKMAEKRHQFLEDYLKQWYLEWDGKV